MLYTEDLSGCSLRHKTLRSAKSTGIRRKTNIVSNARARKGWLFCRLVHLLRQVKGGTHDLYPGGLRCSYPGGVAMSQNGSLIRFQGTRAPETHFAHRVGEVANLYNGQETHVTETSLCIKSAFYISSPPM